MANNSGFSRQEGAHASLLHFAPHHGFVLCTADLPAVRLPRLYRTFHFRPMFPSRVPTVLLPCGTGISTCCPSATLFSLTLGPDFPRQISFTLETLDIRPQGFSPCSRYSFRHSLFLALHSSLRYCFFALRMLLYQ